MSVKPYITVNKVKLAWLDRNSPRGGGGTTFEWDVALGVSSTFFVFAFRSWFQLQGGTGGKVFRVSAKALGD